MNADLFDAIAALGPGLDPGLIVASERLYAPYHAALLPAGIAIERDAPYGPDDRHRLDIFSGPSGAPRPVLLFVHGGGFVMGDKKMPELPYYDNVGIWAVHNGFVGVTMNYRLAPLHRYPAGALDVGAAVAWLRENVARFGGDPRKIVLMGQSAGATHVATYAARRDLHAALLGGIAALVLLSGVYDFSAPEQPPHVLAYFGDPVAAAAASPARGLVASDIPLMLVVAERDLAMFHTEAFGLAGAYLARHGRLPSLTVLAGHNHITEIVHLNAGDAADDVLALNVRQFVFGALPRD